MHIIFWIVRLCNLKFPCLILVLFPEVLYRLLLVWVLLSSDNYELFSCSNNILPYHMLMIKTWLSLWWGSRFICNTLLTVIHVPNFDHIDHLSFFCLEFTILYASNYWFCSSNSLDRAVYFKWFFPFISSLLVRKALVFILPLLICILHVLEKHILSFWFLYKSEQLCDDKFRWLSYISLYVYICTPHIRPTPGDNVILLSSVNYLLCSYL